VVDQEDAEGAGAGAANTAMPTTVTVRRTLKVKHAKRSHCAQGWCGCKGCKKQTVFV